MSYDNEWEIPDIHHDKPFNKWKLRKENQTQEVCPDCGQTFTREMHQQKRCLPCIAKRKIPRNRCECGRIVSIGTIICSFCEKRDRQLKADLIRSQRYTTNKKKPQELIFIKCGKCGTQISAEDLKTFNGLCAECYAKKQIRWDF